MFILYGLAAGLATGRLLGGRLTGLGDIRFRLWPLAILALAVQLVLFSSAADGLAPAVTRAIYVGSTVAVAAVVLANLSVTGLPLVALGAGLNLAAIVANGGVMPASPQALAMAGMSLGRTNSAVLDRPALQPLTDVFALPAWLPLANVFSIGDVLVGLGVALAIAAAMRRERPA